MGALTPPIPPVMPANLESRVRGKEAGDFPMEDSVIGGALALRPDGAQEGGGAGKARKGEPRLPFLIVWFVVSLLNHASALCLRLALAARLRPGGASPYELPAWT